MEDDPDPRDRRGQRPARPPARRRARERPRPRTRILPGPAGRHVALRVLRHLPADPRPSLRATSSAGPRSGTGGELESWPDGRRRLDLEGRTVTLADCWRFGTVDVAASTKTTADYTVISIWAVTPEGDLLLLDRAREQVAQHDHFGLAEPLFERWGQCQLFVERHFFATTLITDAQAAGVPVAEVTADTDKVTRAIPAAARVHSGRVWFPAAAEWLDTWTSELAEFPSGSHDDQVDTLSYAARVADRRMDTPDDTSRGAVWIRMSGLST